VGGWGGKGKGENVGVECQKRVGGRRGGKEREASRSYVYPLYVWTKKKEGERIGVRNSKKEGGGPGGEKGGGKGEEGGVVQHYLLLRQRLDSVRGKEGGAFRGELWRGGKEGRIILFICNPAEGKKKKKRGSLTQASVRGGRRSIPAAATYRVRRSWATVTGRKKGKAELRKRRGERRGNLRCPLRSRRKE